MLDVNLGNKTLTIGVLIALILSYGMVNFDSGTTARQNESSIQAALQNSASDDTTMSTASAAAAGNSDDSSVSVGKSAKKHSSAMLRRMELEQIRADRM